MVSEKRKMRMTMGLPASLLGGRIGVRAKDILWGGPPPPQLEKKIKIKRRQKQNHRPSPHTQIKRKQTLTVIAMEVVKPIKKLYVSDASQHFQDMRRKERRLGVGASRLPTPGVGWREHGNIAAFHLLYDTEVLK
mmetsp:Transcript_19922/g.35541  ORF Transcript_19922/g.35541 Transcript_19922/m.35541 type:complete len:135 (+) Transcript_19922:953-1357(+)